MKIWTEPKVTLKARTQYIDGGEPIQHHPGDDASGAEKIVEYAGRGCYLSWHNPKRRTIAGYIENILEEAHGSVCEHASWTFWIEGVSRSLSHELVRHRVGVAISQLSQRFVEHPEVVVPPLYLAHPYSSVESDFLLRAHSRWVAKVQQEIDFYQDEIEELKAGGIKGKPLREAARSLLPNATETKITWSANARTLRQFIERRAHPAADAEIRRLAMMLLAILKGEAPALFGDFNGEGVPKWSKV